MCLLALPSCFSLQEISVSLGDNSVRQWYQGYHLLLRLFVHELSDEQIQNGNCIMQSPPQQFFFFFIKALLAATLHETPRYTPGLINFVLG